MRSRRTRVLPDPTLTSRRKRRFGLIGVIWTDAVFSHEEESPAPVVMLTVGFRVKSSTKGHISVAHEVGEDGAFRGTTSIPDGMVKQIRRLGSISFTHED